MKRGIEKLGRLRKDFYFSNIIHVSTGIDKNFGEHLNFNQKYIYVGILSACGCFFFRLLSIRRGGGK